MKMKKYFLISNNDFTVYTYNDSKKWIIKDYFDEVKYHKKHYWSFEYKDFCIYQIQYNSRLFDVDYWLDHELYVLNKKTDELEEYTNFKELWIKDKVLNYDFLFDKRK